MSSKKRKLLLGQGLSA